MLLFIIIFASLLIAAALRFSIVRENRRRTLEPQSAQEFEQPVYRSLFAPTAEEAAGFKRFEAEKLLAAERENQKRNLIRRAELGDFDVLIEANELGDSIFYRKTLDSLTETNKIETASFFQLAAFVSSNQLPTDKTFAQTVLAKWRENPQTYFLPTVLHISVLTESAENYLKTIEAIFDSWKQNGLKKVSANQLFAAFDAHFRLLPTSARTSGAGFLLKEKLASIRREVSGK